MTNPNPMNARCGLEKCDCEFVIGGLLRRLELIAEQATLTVKQHHRECDDDSCPCYVAGYESERRP